MDIIFCGALEYKPHQTSDSTSAEIAKQFKTEFVNLTDVKGLHDKKSQRIQRCEIYSRNNPGKF